uniref:Uncharacterized protein n=1 Tax=Candidatus Kentrum sp. LFY TaxID=2126342 RepID=A0A450WSI5_9GAMM|nr:MAG: hypothetical protein BECKLFY1418C_GA0070996_10665 [Candidatus Kentron sp. LFY]
MSQPENKDKRGRGIVRHKDNIIMQKGGHAMGLTYATVQLSNLFDRQSAEIDALVDTGATFLCVTEEVTLQLGSDLTKEKHADRSLPWPMVINITCLKSRQSKLLLGIVVMSRKRL